MSLGLDERQRAMLDEMHVHVWWPRAAPGPDGTLAVERLAAPSRQDRQGSAQVPAQQQEGQAATAIAQPAVVLPDASSTRPVEDHLEWRTLGDTIAACTRCQLSAGRRAAVFLPESAARQADWLVVGEPPDEAEERAGAPFAGQAGQLLDNMLRAVGVARGASGSTGARVTNIVKCRPAAVRNPLPEELALCAGYLQSEMALVQPKVIVAMGRFAALSLLSESHPELAGLPFGKLRGQVHRYRGVPVVVTYHPGRLLRAQEDKANAWADLCLALGVVRQAQALAPGP